VEKWGKDGSGEAQSSKLKAGRLKVKGKRLKKYLTVNCPTFQLFSFATS
jgi:hypothetical protein